MRKLILPPKKEQKNGSKELKNRQNLSFIATSSSVFFPLFLAPLSAELTIKPYGFIRLDPFYSDRNVGGEAALIPRVMPLTTNKAADHPELFIDARFTRVGLKIKEVLNEIHIKGILEVDFRTRDGTALITNSRHPRLRSAYVQARFPSGWFFLVGQTYALFKNTHFIESKFCDWFGPVGAKFGRRQPQLRLGYQYTGDDNTFTWQLDFEQHSLNTLGVVDPTTQTDTSQGSGQRFPLGTTKISWVQKYVTLIASAAIAQSNVTVDLSGREEKKGVYGVNLHAYVRIHPVDLFASVTHIYGLTRLTGEDFPDLVFDESLHLRAVVSNSWYLGGLVHVTSSTTIHAIYAWEKASPIPGTLFSGDARGQFQSLHVNVMQKFWERWKVGIEFQRDTTRTFSGIPGRVNICHAAFWFYF